MDNVIDFLGNVIVNSCILIPFLAVFLVLVYVIILMLSTAWFFIKSALEDLLDN